MRYSSADKREQLIQPWSLSLMVVAVLVVLGMLMPRNSFLASPEMIGSPDALSVAYLQALLRADAGNNQIRMLYAEHLAGTGKIEEADRELRAVDGKTIAAKNRLIFLSLRLSVLRLLKEPDNQKLRLRAEQVLQDVFNLSPEILSNAQWEELASLTLQAGMPAWAANSYLRLASRDKDHEQRWLADAAKWYLASGQAERAGGIQLRLAGMSGDVEDARKAIEYMLAANRSDRAMEALPGLIGQFPADRGLLQKGMQTALAMGRYPVARTWGQAWLQAHPDDVGVMQSLIQVELASGHPAAAFPWAGRLVLLDPESIERRVQFAQISEWTGHTDTALEQWQWLVAHRHEKQDMQRALTLANQLNDYRLVDELLARAASDYGLTQAESSNLASVQEKLGNPEESEKARVAYLKKSPRDKAAWEELAILREYLGKLEESEQTWREIERRFGSSETSVINRARMLSVTGRQQDGLEVMRDYAEKKHPESERFWQVYGDLAWNLEYHADAFKAYRWLWDHDKAESFETQRLMILLREEGDVETTLAISQQAWQRFHDPEVLLLAIESAIQVARWKDVKRLVAIAEAEIGLFRDRRRYWLAHARLMIYENRLDYAENDYQVALNLSPTDADARTGLLWIWIQSNQRNQLKRHLALWQHDAAEQEVYWQPYAAGYRQLGRAPASLPWFRKTLRAHPDDMLWMLEYADALADSGQASGAWRLRSYLFRKVWPKSRLSPEYVNKNGIAMVEAVTRLKRRMLGLPHAQGWVQPLLEHSDDPVVREFAMRWYFGIEQHEQASFWLMRQHQARLEAPAWQQLALAMERNDLDRIQHILATVSGIDHASRLLAYRQLHHLDDAWVLAMDTGMGAGQFNAVEQTTMLRHARDIASLSPNAAHLGWSYDHFGSLNLSQLGAKGFYSRENHTLSMKAKITSLNAAAGFAVLENKREFELQLGTGFEFRRGDWMAYAGANDRNKGAFNAGRLLQWGTGIHWRPWQGGELGMSVAVNETSLETSAFRLVGARDRAQFSFSSDITNREYFASNLNLNRYQTRIGEAIARGYSVDATLGHRLTLANSLAEEQMQVRLSGELSNNRLEASLSPYALHILPNTAVSGVIPQSFASLGVGLNIQRDVPGNDEAIARMPIYLFDSWLGWQWPGSTLAYSITVGAGVPLLGRDMLSLRAYVANSVVGSVSNESLYGVALWYSYRFGR